MTGTGPSGVLRAALNLNNAALVQKAGDSYTGLAPDLARRIADAAGRQLRFVDYPSARAIVKDTAQAWDIAFLAIDPSRLDRLAFSKPYHSVEATFLVQADQSSCSEVLAGEHRIISAKGAAYHSPLAAEVGGDRLIVAESPAEAAELFRQGHGEALAGIRETLGTAGSGTRVLPDVFARIEQAVAVPIGASDLMRQIELCVQDVIASDTMIA